uniref:Reverse transcriptase domain-containing protein n=1 Tax=Tanacetum cinerariifolium TaxID=118510 RepID=A0A6L2JCJ9_TANCI|nr:reverse transcriptase domain-containing protein [Tanacetum cinerariifolium]
MAPKRTTRANPTTTTTTTTTSVTDAQLEALIEQGVAKALATRDADRNMNGDDSLNSGTSARRTERVTRECTYPDFMKCKPLNFKGTKGVFELTQWFENMETVFRISNCSVENQIKFSTCTLLGSALMWWNCYVMTVGPDAAYAMTWVDMKKQMTEKYCSRGEMKKLENKIERYVGGLPDVIHESVVPSRPKTMQEAIKMANELMDKRNNTWVERQSINHRGLHGTVHGGNRAHEGRPLNEKSLLLAKRKVTHHEEHRTSQSGTLQRRDLTSMVSQREGRGSSRFTPLTRTPKEILVAEVGKFQPPLPIVTPVEKRSSNKFCDFHNDKGHSTNECMQLIKYIEELVRAGKLSHLIKEIKQGRDQSKVGKKEAPVKDKSMEIYMIQSWQRMTRLKVTQSFERVKEIRFPSLATSSGTEGPLVIEAKIGGHMIQRMSLSSYNGIIGRPRIKEIQAVPSTSHGMLKFPADGRIVTIRSTILIPAECATVITLSKEIPKEAGVRHENFKLNISSISGRDIHPFGNRKGEGLGTREGHPSRAFKQLKQHLSKLPLLVPPKPKVELIVHLSASYGAISAVLMTKRGTVQTPVYFVSRAIQDPKLNYTPMEKLFLSLVFTAKRLRRYFQPHPVAVITDQPIKQIMSRPDVEGRLQKWSVMPREHNITYRPRTSSKGQVLANFLVEMPDESPPDASVVETQQEPWTLFTDGSSCVDGSGAGLILTSPEGTKFTYALRFQFTASNNEAKYEALPAGLRIIAHMGVRNVHVNVDSKLVENQVLGAYVAKEENMIKYLEKVKSLVSGLANLSINQVSRSKNKKVNTLSKIASTSFGHLSKQGSVEILKEKSIQEKEVTTVAEEDGPTWMTQIKEYLKKWTLPGDRKEATKPRIKARQYELLEGVLNRRMEAVIPTEIGMPTYRTTVVDVVHNDEELQLNLDLLEERRERAAIHEAKAKLKMTKYYNTKVCGVTFRPSDFVYRSNDASHAVDGGKLSSKWEGPYEVTKALGDGAYKRRSTDETVLPRT